MHDKRSIIKHGLVIAGTSSLAGPLIETLLEKNYRITATYRTKPKAQESRKVDWVHFDLEQQESFNSFINSTSFKNYDIIIYCEGSMSSYIKESEDAISHHNYMETHIIKPILLLNIIFKNLATKGTVVYLSSVSARNGSFDPLYATAKAAIHKFIQSMQFHIQNYQRIVIAVPTLVEDSQMYLDMSQENREKHRKRMPGDLLTKHEVSKTIFNTIESRTEKFIEIDNFRDA